MSALTPNPAQWPMCPTCFASYVLRRDVLGARWVWMRDCKHKLPPVIGGEGEREACTLPRGLVPGAVA